MWATETEVMAQWTVKAWSELHSFLHNLRGYFFR